MKSGQIRKKEERATHQSPSPAGKMAMDEARRPMRILIATQGYCGERMVENIRGHARASWEVNHITLPAALPPIIDETDEFTHDSSNGTAVSFITRRTEYSIITLGKRLAVRGEVRTHYNVMHSQALLCAEKERGSWFTFSVFRLDALCPKTDIADHA